MASDNAFVNCPECGRLIPITSTSCPYCSHSFHQKVRPQSTGSTHWPLIVLAIIIPISVVAYLLGSRYLDIVDMGGVKVAEKWSQCVNTADTYDLEKLYADDVDYYMEEHCSRQKIMEEKEEFFEQNPHFAMEATDFRQYRVAKDEVVVSFTNRYTKDGDRYQSVETFLTMKFNGRLWLITKETDSVTKQRVE